jgi:hypothetical protein
LTEPNAPTSTGEPRVHPDRPVDPKTAELRAEKNSVKRLGKALGPGLITGASDLVLSMLISNNHAAMGQRTNGRVLNVVGWATMIIMGVASIGLIVTTILG